MQGSTKHAIYFSCILSLVLLEDVPQYEGINQERRTHEMPKTEEGQKGRGKGNRWDDAKGFHAMIMKGNSKMTAM